MKIQENPTCTKWLQGPKSQRAFYRCLDISMNFVDLRYPGNFIIAKLVQNLSYIYLTTYHALLYTKLYLWQSPPQTVLGLNNWEISLSAGFLFLWKKKPKSVLQVSWYLNESRLEISRKFHYCKIDPKFK